MKLNDLTLSDAFFQVNLVRGYRFFDIAGQIMNDLDDRFAEKEIGLQGLIVRSPTDPEDHLREMRVSADQIWLHFGTETSWSELRQEVPELVDRLASMMTIGGFRRRALRTMLLHPIEDLDAGVRLLTERAYNADLIRWHELGQVFGAQLQTRFRTRRVGVNLTIRPIRILKGQPSEGSVEDYDLIAAEISIPKLPDTALMVDADVYDDRKTSDLSVKPIINHAVELLEDDILPLVSRLLAEEGA